MNKIIGFAFLTLMSRTLSDDCEGDRFGFYSIVQSLYIFEDGTVNLKGDERPIVLELPSELYTGKDRVIHGWSKVVQDQTKLNFVSYL